MLLLGLELLTLLLLLEQLVQLRLAQLGKLLLSGLTCGAGGNGLWGSERRRLPREELLLLGGKLLLLGSKLLLLGGKLLLGRKRLLRLEGRLLGREGSLKVSGQRINLAILVFITGKTLKSNVFQGQLVNWNQGGSLGLGLSKLLGLLGKLLLLRGKRSLLLLLKGRLLLEGRLLGSKLLLLRSKLLLPGSKLLLLLRSKLLLLLSKLSLELLGLLLLGLELLEVLVEVLSVELLAGGLLRVELCSIKDRPPLISTTLVGKGSPLGLVVTLCGNVLLSLDDSRLMSNDSCMTLLLQLESWALGLGLDLGLGLGDRVVHRTS